MIRNDLSFNCMGGNVIMLSNIFIQEDSSKPKTTIPSVQLAAGKKSTDEEADLESSQEDKRECNVMYFLQEIKFETFMNF